MRFSRKIKVEDNDMIMNINLKVNTDGKYLTREESIKEFNYRLDNIMKGLLDNYHYNEIKVRR